jgi:hypothetical protein
MEKVKEVEREGREGKQKEGQVQMRIGAGFDGNDARISRKIENGVENKKGKKKDRRNTKCDDPEREKRGRRRAGRKKAKEERRGNGSDERVMGMAPK